MSDSMKGQNINMFIADGTSQNENDIYNKLQNIKSLPLSSILFIKTKHNSKDYFQPYLVDEQGNVYQIGLSYEDKMDSNINEESNSDNIVEESSNENTN